MGSGSKTYRLLSQGGSLNIKLSALIILRRIKSEKTRLVSQKQNKFALEEQSICLRANLQCGSQRVKDSFVGAGHQKQEATVSEIRASGTGTS
jgi:hypothetical protein